jgi:hypothetical protein
VFIRATENADEHITLSTAPLLGGEFYFIKTMIVKITLNNNFFVVLAYQQNQK